MTRGGLGLLAALALVAGGCQIRSFELDSRDGGQPVPDGGGTSDVLLPADGPPAGDDGAVPGDGGGGDVPCIRSNGGVEICDGLDNDCDGVVDNVDPARLDHDPNNCGSCFTVCADQGRHVTGQCSGGTCGTWACDTGYRDPDGDLAEYPSGDGCECQVTNGGTEVCDGLDNNCNGLTDEGFDTAQSPNCGVCGVECSFDNAAASCEPCSCTTDPECKGCGAGGTGGHKCAMGACIPNPNPAINAIFVDLDGDPATGCEYYCILPPGQPGPLPEGTEVCDGYDNDCDGCVDGNRTGFDAAGRPMCEPNPALTTGTCGQSGGECRLGAITCQDGYTDCFGAVGPAPEVCDGKDNDCDGQTDEGFDRQNDPNYCAGAGYGADGLCKPCSVPHAVAKCVAGVCGIDHCLPGWIDKDGDSADGCETACSPTNGGVEICDGLDNNCNGLTDEGFDLASDPLNCGTCGHACTYPHAAGQCVAGACHMAGCEPGWWDANHVPADGCEYACQLTNGGVEICDGLDNDCNGQIDEGFDKQTDSNNCGSCGTKCTYYHAQALCVGGACQMGACEAGWVDLDHLASTGCEYQCTVTNGGTEICDGKDNDCNGLTDEIVTGKGTGCTAGKGVCVQSGSYICAPAATDPSRTSLCCGSGDPNGAGMCLNPLQGAGTETCNGLDDDCDGVVDDVAVATVPGSPIASDPANCGACGQRCDVLHPNSHANWGCSVGVCIFQSCQTGWWDLDGDHVCEYQCTPTTPPTEVCDGKDNDCNGTTDMDDPGLQWPANFCVQKGECRNGTTGANDDPRADAHYGTGAGQITHPVCRGDAAGVTWYCNYPTTVDLPSASAATASCSSATGWVAGCTPTELHCDGLDNNCDGVTDDRWPAKGTTCYEDGTYGTTAKLGQCQGHGTLTCVAGLLPLSQPPSAGLTCTGITGGLGAQPETCDGIDNDCDGLTDELWNSSNSSCPGGICTGVRDSVVLVRGNATRFPSGIDTTNGVWVYQYEAARPDASGTAPGSNSARACSKTGALPWGSVDLQEAREACSAAGMRLCTRSEWSAACEGACDLYRSDGCWKTAHSGTGGAAGGPIATSSPFFLFTGAGFTAADVGGLLGYGGNYYSIDRYVSATQVEAVNEPTAPAAASGLAYTVLWQQSYPYGTTYQPYWCDGNDYPTGSTTDGPVATGSLAQCVTQTTYPLPGGGTATIADLSGNVKEWTEDYRTTLASGQKSYSLRGGGYTDAAAGLTCDFLDGVAGATFTFPDAGFRCCLPGRCAPTSGQAVCPAASPKTCTVDGDCAATGARCATISGGVKRCVTGCAGTACAASCLADSFCATGAFCSEPIYGTSACSTSCTADSACTSLGGFCDQAADSSGRRTCVKCVDFGTDPLNCGGCGIACLNGFTCQNGICK